MNSSTQIIKDCKIGKSTRIYNFVNLYECIIGENCIIGSFVEIQRDVTIGNKVRIGSHSFLCEGITIEDDVFVGHSVTFVNDNYPRSVNKNGEMKTKKDWKLLRTIIRKRASIGSNATILGGIKIGRNSMIGAGAVVTKNVPANSIVVGNPAKVIKKINF
jgi:acetyltransferase-like isoleucine patch superfamily enzyme